MRIPLVIAFTPNYIVPAAVTLKSILDSTADENAAYDVHCLVTEEIPQRQKDELLRLAGCRMTFRYLGLKGRLDGLYIDPRYSEAASYRLLLPELLPEIDKIIYLDCDIVVRQDLSQIFAQTDLGDNLLAAVYEAPIERQAERWTALGCDPGKYFNSGFLVMNLRQMRLEKTSARLLDALNVSYLEFPDQDALNQVCKGRVTALSPVCNSIRTFLLPQYKNDFVRQYSEEAWVAVQENGTIHYTGGKPWTNFTVKFGEWWKTYFNLPDDIRGEWKPNAKIRLLARIYCTAAGKIAMDTIRNLYRKIR